MNHHYRCGGRLTPVGPPAWAQYADHPDHGRTPEFARCARCGLPGELAPAPTKEDSMRIKDDSAYDEAPDQEEE